MYVQFEWIFFEVIIDLPRNTKVIGCQPPCLLSIKYHFCTFFFFFFPEERFFFEGIIEMQSFCLLSGIDCIKL